MTILPTLALLLLVESLAALLFSVAAIRSHLVADRRLGLEASIALEAAIAEARVQSADALAALPPASIVALPPPVLPGWDVSVRAEREADAPLVRLRVAVVRRDPAGRALAARQGTLLLARRAADTAIVLDNRPEF